MLAGRQLSALGRLSGAVMQGLGGGPLLHARSSASAAVKVLAAGADPAGGVPDKKPSSGYILFVSDQYKTIAARNPDKKGKDIMSLMGAEWKKMTDSQKEKYQGPAAEAKKAYDLKYPPGSRPKRVSKPSKEPKQPKGPKKAPNGYNVYVAQRLPALRKPGQAAPEAMSLVAKEWKTLSQSEKDQWKQKAAAAAPPAPSV